MYGDPIHVWTDDEGRPTRFVWRGRLFTVLAVLEHREISHEWWRDKGPDDPGPQAGREFWRVRAAPGKEATPGVYELRCDPGADTWLLARILD